jgi:hypothetical protein
MGDADDRLIPLREAAKHFPGRGGKKIALTTLYRWSASGTRGVRLRTWQVGSIRCTTAAAISQFISELTARRDGQPVVERAPVAARRRQEAVAKQLDAVGI